MKLETALRFIFFGVIVRPVIVIMLGLNARNIDRLKPRGAHLIAANHNSHLDTMVLLSLFKLSDLRRVKVVAAKDYFCRNRFMTWFSVKVIGIIPIDRTGKTGNPVKPIIEALDEDYTVILFPEGSRGEPEQQADLKQGITMITKARTEVRITPVYLYGLGKALPRGEALLVPFICDINVGEAIGWEGNRKRLMDKLHKAFEDLKSELEIKPWV